MVWTRYKPMWAERGISRLFFNIVPTDITAFVPPFHELEEPLSVKVGVLRPYGCFSVFTVVITAPFECPLQSREEVEVARRQVGTVGAWSRLSQPKVAIWLRVSPAVWGLASSNILVCPSRNCWHHRRTICVDMTSGPYTSTRCLWMLGGHALFRCPVFNTALRRHRLRDEGRTFHNTRGRLSVYIEHSDIHQFYAVTGNKMGKLIFRLSYVLGD
jgi:hypothetical protein